MSIGRDGARGTATIDGVGSTLTVDDTIHIGRNGGFGTLNIQNGGTVTAKGNTTNIGIGSPGSTGVLNVNTGGTLNEATTVNVGSAGNTGTLNVDGGGNVVIGFDPVGLPGGTGNTVNDAIVSVGLEEVGALNVTNSAVNITATGPGPSDSSLLQIGGRFGGTLNNTANARGDVLVDNSTVTMDATGGGATVVTVGRGTDSSVNTDPATAPENTLTIQNGSIFNVKNSGTGTAFFNVGRDSARGTATIDGAGTTMNSEDIINIGRNGGSGMMIIQNNATVNHTAGVVDAIVRVGGQFSTNPTPGSGTLKINNGGTLNIKSGIGRDDAFLFISNSPTSSETMQGTVIVGDDPSTGAVETGGTINIESQDNDAVLRVGGEGPGGFRATNSTITIKATGLGPSDNATVEIGDGGLTPGVSSNAVGQMVLTNSNLTLETNGASAFASIIVGRETVAATAAAAPENTFVAEAGSVVTIDGKGLNGNAGFTAGDRGSKATVTFRGTGTTLNVDDFVNVGRRNALGVMNVEDNAVINADIDATARARIGRQGGTGTLNINTGGVFNGRLVEIGVDGIGTVNVSNGGALFANNIVNGANGTLSGGGGTITGTIDNTAGGTIAAGNSPGLMEIFGNLNLNGMSTMEIELAGTVFDTGIPQFDYDRIIVADDLATLANEGIVTIDPDAIFDVSLIDMFTVSAGDVFDVLVAEDIQGDLTLASFLLPILGDGLLWDTEIVALRTGEALRLSVVGQQVSEPGTLLLLLGGLSGLAILRRRRSKAS